MCYIEKPYSLMIFEPHTSNNHNHVSINHWRGYCWQFSVPVSICPIIPADFVYDDIESFFEFFHIFF